MGKWFLRCSALFAAVLLLLVTGSCDDSSDGNTEDDVFDEGLTFVSQWNELALAAVRTGGARPTVTTRQLFLVHAAIYDAWTMYDTEATPFLSEPDLKRPTEEHTLENKQRAVAQAAYHMLTRVFPAYASDTDHFAENMRRLGYDIVAQTDSATPEGIGLAAVESVWTARSSDGSNPENDYADTVSDLFPELYQPVNHPDPDSMYAPGRTGFDPNRWQPLRVPNGALLDEMGVPIFDNADASTYSDQAFLTPHWGAVTPFALTSPDQFRPQAPPQRNSSAPYTDALGVTSTNDDAWNQQFDEVLAISAALTDRQKVIAEFWADGPRTESPPGHWNQLAHGVAERDGHTVDDDAKMYFALTGALLDAGIATWEAKRFYDYIRPASAIRDKYYGELVRAWGGPDQGTQEILGQNWRPYQNVTFVTPPFAEYVSGHSTFSASAAEVLTRFTGSPTFYDGETVTSQDVNFDGDPDLLGVVVAVA